MGTSQVAVPGHELRKKRELWRDTGSGLRRAGIW